MDRFFFPRRYLCSRVCGRGKVVSPLFPQNTSVIEVSFSKHSNKGLAVTSLSSDMAVC